MRNTQENFPEVPVENLSDWQVIRKTDGLMFDVTSTLLDESFTEVTFGDDTFRSTTKFTPAAGEQLANDQYSVVFKYGGEPVVDANGTK